MGRTCVSGHNDNLVLSVTGSDVAPHHDLLSATMTYVLSPSSSAILGMVLRILVHYHLACLVVAFFFAMGQDGHSLSSASLVELQPQLHMQLERQCKASPCMGRGDARGITAIGEWTLVGSIICHSQSINRWPKSTVVPTTSVFPPSCPSVLASGMHAREPIQAQLVGCAWFLKASSGCSAPFVAPLVALGHPCNGRGLQLWGRVRRIRRGEGRRGRGVASCETLHKHVQKSMRIFWRGPGEGYLCCQ